MKGIAGLVLASMLLLVGCYTGPSADHFVAVVDELDVPPDWEVADTVVRGPEQPESCDPFFSTECPAAIRTYLVESDGDAAYTQAKEVITLGGFVITEEGAACSSSSSIRLPCTLWSKRGDDELRVSIFTSPVEAGVEDVMPGVVAVVVHAN